MSRFFIRIAFAMITALMAQSAAASSKQTEAASGTAITPESQACIACHAIYTPGIVKDWQSSRHAHFTPAMSLKLPDLERRMSAPTVPERYAKFAVGCYECHSQNPDAHKDNFKHNGYRINVLVTPNDCKTCHEKEVAQYAHTKKANAIKILLENPVYHALVKSTVGSKTVENGKITVMNATNSTLNDTCLGCHGTKIEVNGMKKITTRLGDMSVPNLTNWPNNGVGRENPDGSFGSCASCHPRHSFSIEVARKPYTCAQCHLEPDVPAYNVYKESKHGNLYESLYHEFNFKAVPWKVGTDFKTPTCAGCHNSLLTTPDGAVIAERTHDFGSRLWVRIFGLPYSHPQPKSGDTTIIRNRDGLPLPTTFTGEPASEYLIDKREQEKRQGIMKGVCTSCHTTAMVESHFEKLDSTNRETDAMVLAATKLMSEAWDKKLEDKSNPFDETIEKLWIKQWLFYANSVRYASAMTGAPDYAAFKNGWWELSDTLTKMRDAIDFKAFLKAGESATAK